MNNNGYYGGMFFDMLTVAFIVLKLCGIIDWPWWRVLSPLWIPIIVISVGLFLMGIGKKK